jgi:hypothetical protein
MLVGFIAQALERKTRKNNEHFSGKIDSGQIP